MSAYICSPKLFGALGMYAATRQFGGTRRVHPGVLADILDDTGVAATSKGLYDMTDEEYAILIAEILRHENIRSVKARYPSDSDDGLPGHPFDAPIPLNHNSKVAEPVTILKSCDCLEYQSCETDDYQQSGAYRILNAIRKAAIHDLPGYEDAPWGIR